MMILSFFAALVLAFAAAGCSVSEADALAPTHNPVVIARVVARTPAQPLLRRGTVRGGSRLHLGFDTPGVLTTITVRNGDPVQRGALLAKLRAGEARATLRSAAVRRAQAANELHLTNRLVESGTGADDTLSRAKADLQIARANEAAAAEVLAHTRLVAPLSGTVLNRLAEPGESVAAGAPILVIEDTSNFIVDVGVIEADLARVRRGQSVEILLDDRAPVPARVTSIAPAPNPTNGLYAVEVTPFPHPEVAALHSGTMVDVRFVEDKPPDELRVPLESIVPRRNKAFVAVIKSAGSESTVDLREVTIDHTEAREVALRAGLKEGERIVSEGAQFLRSGQAVRIQEERRP